MARNKNNKKFALRTPGPLLDKVYKKASSENQSVNEIINRCLNHALISDKIYFELQYLNTGEKFKFKLPPDHFKVYSLHLNSYRLLKIDQDKGTFIIQRIGNFEPQELKFSENFYKLIYTI